MGEREGSREGGTKGGREGGREGRNQWSCSVEEKDFASEPNQTLK